MTARLAPADLLATAAPATLLVLAKEPVPGRVKTRLSPPLSERQAAEVARAALADTLQAVAATPAVRRVLVLEGDQGDWLPPGFEVVKQRGAGLDQRLASAFEDTADGNAMLLIGMDTPQVSPALLVRALTRLQTADAILGLASDGGWWTLGLAAGTDRELPGRLLRGVPMSAAHTGSRQRARLAAEGLSTALLPVLRDVDTAEDAVEVAGLVPAGRFAGAVAAAGLLNGFEATG